MAVLTFLKILSDTALYMTIAGPIALKIGASGWLIAVSAVAIAFAHALSYLLREKKALKWIPYILPFFTAFLPGTTVVWAVVSAIPLVYAIVLSARGMYISDAEHQKSVFKAGLGVFVGMLIVMLMMSGTEEMYTFAVFSTLVGLVCSVLIMRSLRHEPEVYTKPSFQLLNAAIMVVTLVVILILSLEDVINGFFAGVKFVYTYIAYGFYYALMFSVQWMGAAIEWLTSLLKGQAQTTEAVEINLDNTSAEDLFGELPAETSLPAGVRIGLIVAAVIAVALILFLIFRALAGRRASANVAGKREKPRYDNAPSADIHRQPLSASSQGVRRQYRIFLEFLQKKGQEISPSETSLDIGRVSVTSMGETAQPQARELRELYLKARYNNASDKEDAERARQLVKEIRKNTPKTI